MTVQRQEKLIPGTSLTEFFKERVERALAHRRINASSVLAFYLVNLLQEFRKTEKLFESQGSKMFEKPLALILADAVKSDANTRIRCLKQLGDVSLYTAGFFTDRVRKKSVGLHYYIRMGEGAYSNLAGILARQKTFAELYQELASQFPGLVGVLGEVATNLHWKSNSELLKLYEKWLATGNAQIAGLLKEAGILSLDFTPRLCKKI